MRNEKTHKAMIDDIMSLFTAFTIKYFLFTLRDDQIVLARAFFDLLFKRKRHTLNVSVCRQTGKTEVLVMCILFAILYFEIIEKERIRICVCAPEQGTSTEFFDRLKAAMNKLEQAGFVFRFQQKNYDAIVDSRGNRVDKFGLFKNYARIENKKSTREGRTFHLVIRDEKHMGDDSIFDDEIVPAMATTGGLDVLIGNGGFKYCRAKQISDMFTDKGQIIQTIGAVTNFEADYTMMRAIMLEEYEKTGNEMFIRWIDSQDAYIEQHGIDNPFVQKNLFNKWFTETQNFIDIQRLRTMARQNDESLHSPIIHIGLDLAKSQDDTVMTLTDDECNVRDWLEFKGEYPQQVRLIREALLAWKEKNRCAFEYLFVDSTGVGDPVKAMLKEAIGDIVIVRGIVFTSKEKDILARKALKAFAEENLKKRFSYPANHERTEKFENQMVSLVKDYYEDGRIKYGHPTINGAKDDYADSTFLSMYKIQNINTTQMYGTNTVDY
jgi:hypothetical protein